MQSSTFRRKNFAIGSGLAETGCKRSDMRWSEPDAENVLALQWNHASRRLDEFWKERLNTHADRHDCPELTYRQNISACAVHIQDAQKLLSNFRLVVYIVAGCGRQNKKRSMEI